MNGTPTGLDTQVVVDRRVLAGYDNYLAAQRTVDALSDAGFPVENVAIVGSDLKLEETVTGRMTNGRAALTGAGSGAAFGAVVGMFPRPVHLDHAVVLRARALGGPVGCRDGRRVRVHQPRVHRGQAGLRLAQRDRRRSLRRAGRGLAHGPRAGRPGVDPRPGRHHGGRGSPVRRPVRPGRRGHHGPPPPRPPADARHRRPPAADRPRHLGPSGHLRPPPQPVTPDLAPRPATSDLPAHADAPAGPATEDAPAPAVPSSTSPDISSDTPRDTEERPVPARPDTAEHQIPAQPTSPDRSTASAAKERPGS
ncbi:general stress protein [Streptosporangium vulgare]|uniref:general stress protein n=1 Tax=Streptosporangium vulgare TaxID=46190 RepID=UPI0031DAE37E